jgi:protein gp37
LTLPLCWKKPRRIFVNSMSDLFHEAVHDAWIDFIFAVMVLSPQHTFLVLTKRPERMRDYLTHRLRECLIGQQADLQHLARTDVPVFEWSGLPLPNVWLGVSVEDQATADARIPHLLATPAAKRFVSAEPLSAPFDLAKH